MPYVPILAADDPISHVVDHQLLGWYVSNTTVMLFLSALITFLLMRYAAARIMTGKGGSLDDYRAKGVVANLIEAICLFLRNDVFKPVLGDQTDKFAPILWTLFWFILICNMMGLVPLLDLTATIGKVIGVPIGYGGHGIGGTATQSIYVTVTLAVIAFLYWNVIAIRKDWRAYLKHMTGGAPVYVWWIMIPVEIIGMLVKPAALAIRLFANMTGGHILLAVVLGFVGQVIVGMGTVGFAFAIIPLVGAVAIYLLEVLVGTIQAYIFTFLTCLFLGQLVVHEHDEHAEHEHDREEEALGVVASPLPVPGGTGSMR
ncbi:MAG: F0F1 ATP synthase subunit A [Phycisphaeraceae bacterium]|nr:F0F1 ATP synthase subunit A [Phycisphaeraceae bacterium]